MTHQGFAMRHKEWSPADVQALRTLYPHHTAAAIGQQLGRAAGSIWRKANQVGIQKSATFLASAQSGRIQRGKQHPKMQATQFQPGMAPWNKGIKGSTGLHPNSQATQFKKGEMAGAAQHNYKPIGSLRITKDGYLEQKVTDAHPVPARRWIALHRLVWEATHGPTPPGHIVRFKPGMATTKFEAVTLDRLECITRAENLKRNQPNTSELRQLVQLKGAINRQVNRIVKKATQT